MLDEKTRVIFGQGIKVLAANRCDIAVPLFSGETKKRPKGRDTPNFHRDRSEAIFITTAPPSAN
jgi:hypothetical protein